MTGLFHRMICLLAAGLAGLLILASPPARAQGSSTASAYFSSNQGLKPPAMSEMMRQATERPSGEDQALERPVDPETYVLGPGDLLGISLVGGVDEVYRARVSQEGKLMIPMVPVINVGGMTLQQAGDTIQARWGGRFIGTTFDVSLIEIRNFRVSIAGAVVEPGTYVVSPAYRVTSLIELAGGKLDEIYWRGVYNTELAKIQYNWEMLERMYDMPLASDRRAVLYRADGEEVPIDLQRIERSGSESSDPFLRAGDRVVISYKNDDAPTVKIVGAVVKPGMYEWLPGDKVGDLVEVAGGLLPNAGLDSVQLTRFSADAIDEILELDLSQDESSGPELHPGDLILVRHSALKPRRVAVQVKGEVVYPGDYAITVGETKLSEVIELAGGLTDRAFASGVQVWRQRNAENLRIKEERIRLTDPVNLVDAEKQFYRFNYRWRDYDNVGLDADALLDEGDRASDIFLEEGDVINVPDRTRTVLLLGHVNRPGVYPYVEGWILEDYVEAAGDFTRSARKRATRLIRYETNMMVRAKGGDAIHPGDTILVPEAPDQLTWYTFKDILTVLSQAATVFVVIFSVTR